LKNLLLLLFITLNACAVKAQTGYTCADAIPLTNLNNACSDSAHYNNSNPSQNGQTWFSFVADTDGVYITVNGRGAGGSLPSPRIKLLLGNCNGDTVAGTSTTTNNVTTYFSGNLQKGVTYYVTVTGANNQTGSFKLCINNLPAEANPVTCAKAVYLCDTSGFDFIRSVYTDTEIFSPTTEMINTVNIRGTCLHIFDAGDYWFKWKAANSGTLVFNIVPETVPEYHEFVLYDLGLLSDCSNAMSANVIRCMGWSPLFCNNTQTNPIGLSFTENDVSESNVCGRGQNGRLKYVDMVQGHYYALAIAVDNGIENFNTPKFNFTLSFTDENGKAGTARFAPPQPQITYVSLHTGCTSDLTYTFTCPVLTYPNLHWDFADGTLLGADANRNYTVRYTTPGTKTVVLNATNSAGCAAADTITFTITPPHVIAQPVITANKPSFCIGDTILLSTAPQPGLNYVWTGPNQFTSKATSISLPITTTTQAGAYTLTAFDGACPGPSSSTINLGPFLNRPKAAFTTKPGLPASAATGTTVQFTNQSANADSYLWDFGDGTTSTTANPSHPYTQAGTFKITLTAYQSTACSNSVTEGTLTIGGSNGGGGTTFIPNVFTPNGDGINDEFTIVISNITSFHLQIYNRYGQQLFETRDIGNRWTGNYNGKKLPEGAYYYIINTVSQIGKAATSSGYVVLIR
jgi:gliding motility-associated-like protein